MSDPEEAWRDLLRAVGRDDLFCEHFSEYTPQAVTGFLISHPGNPDSVIAASPRTQVKSLSRKTPPYLIPIV